MQKVTQAVVTPQATFKPHQNTERFALFNVDGTPVNFDGGEATDPLTVELGTIPSVSAAAIDAGDTILEALAKLQAQIDALPGD